MTTLTGEMLDALVIESQSLPAELLKAYRNPPGRKPTESALRIRDALADMDDATALLLLRDAVDAAVFQMDQGSVKNRVWVGSSHWSSRAANGGLASLLENSCHSATAPEAAMVSAHLTLARSKV